MFYLNKQLSSGYDLLMTLKAHYTVGDHNSWWWPSFCSIEIKEGIEVRGALDSKVPNLSLCFASILGQNTRYENAWFALISLYEYLFSQLDSLMNFTSCQITPFKDYKYPHLAFISQAIWQDSLLEILHKTSPDIVARLICKAGFYNQKSHRILLLAKNILQDFGSFDSFAKEVSKEWLLSQKGIGKESASSILNYGLKREEMVVDKYTQKLLANLGYEYETYEDIQGFLCKNLIKAKELYDFDISPAQIMARLHGKIVEHCKYKSKK
ncbi:endonuclease III [Helicobacter sp. MIT 14-3879]|uniref:endonuclease III n=1 Tax=Helicobacter sp. MIT 14-3879 TaxID=2040649 RepID=UPI000E1F9109|nr:endonuclease III [Helicobacter sp. MIT 14-3879]RDU60899.1 endonuclease III [Helicobacter sp. MIT 14-3879]